MSSNKKTTKSLDKSTRSILVIAGIAILLAVVLFLTQGKDGSEQKEQNTSAGGQDLVISKSDITDKVKFYPLSVNGRDMEILAVKAEDGTIRTAFNTCQVCNGSPLAYYKQEGDVIVCQNCGNRFSMDMIEEVRGGCNPIPVGTENKVEDESSITISRTFIEKNRDLFTENWKDR